MRCRRRDSARRDRRGDRAERGCGKSTLLHCLAGILPVDQGAVVYRDQNIGLWSEAGRSRLRRTEFGVLFQFGQLVPELTAAENVALPLLLGGAGRRRARAAVGILIMRSSTDLEELRAG